MHLCLVKLSPTPELSMQAFFGAKPCLPDSAELLAPPLMGLC